MKHNWIKYKNDNDQQGENSFYCSFCKLKTWTASSGIRYNEEGGLDYEQTSCEEYIIKNIIE